MSDDSRNLPLADRLRTQIRRIGPMTFHDWMQAALYDEREGYYRRAGLVRQGRTGDYRTAPETSQLFGETFANYFEKSYFDLGAPGDFTIVEIGAGRGDFARAVLNSFSENSHRLFAITRYVIDEISDDARLQAASNLAEFKDRVEFRSLSSIKEPLRNAIVFSNELLDAFPVHRVVGRGESLRELFVTVSDSGEFVWSEGALTPLVAEYCDRIGLKLSDQQIFEVNLAAEDLVARVASAIYTGLLISVDYGAERAALLNDPNRLNGTLRAFRRHRMIDEVLSLPGELDLTTTVDWTQIMETGKHYGLETLRLQRLDQFLIGEGLLDGMMKLTAPLKSNAEILSLHARARELIMPDGLAAHFQVLVQRKEP